MKGVQQQLRDEYLLAGDIRNEPNASSGFEAIEVEKVMVSEEREMWLDNSRQQDDLLVDINDTSIFYGDFPPLPDFPCMSSSSSSPSTPAPLKAIACSSSASTASSSSSAACWAVLKLDADEDHIERRNNCHGHCHDHHGQDDLADGTSAALSSTASMEIHQRTDQANVDVADCIHVMENFGYMDLLDNNDFFDPSSIFHHDDTGLEEFHQEQKPQEQSQQLEQQVPMIYSGRNEETQENEKASDDLAMVFLDWLKTNKETVSAEDLRRVKIKKATIECAAKRLGGGKEAMKQLLKLILEWVQTNHLQKRRIKESASNNNIDLPYQYQDPFQNPNPNPTSTSNPNLNFDSVPAPETNSCFSQPPWIPQPAYITGSSAAAAVVPGFAPVVGYMGDLFANGAPNVNSHTYQSTTDYQMLDSAQTWRPSQFALASQYNSFPDSNLHPVPSQPSAFTGYGNQYSYMNSHNNDQRVVRLGSSATKEARKKRMARQRRFAPHHRNHHNHNHQQSQHQNQSVDQHARLMNDNCVVAATAKANTGNWVYWPAVAGGGLASNPPPVLPGDVPVVHVVDRPAMQVQIYQRQVASDRRQVGSLIFIGIIRCICCGVCVYYY